MPGFLGGSSGGSSGSGGAITGFPKEFVDPVTKLRVSNPQNLIDTDFEYGLQPTKWETVELINNTPSFFSKSGDTTIPNIVAITTNAGTREITVTTGLSHGLAVGIPINVTGTKSITADGAYIINSIPNATTFTYLCKDIQPETSSIEDLYSSIITGEFFQGSQLRIADSEGITTDGESISTLTVKTESPHGFNVKTPFYFLNLNSTISQEFEAANTAARSFDSSNSATAQTFDGSNSLSRVNIDWSNSATVGGVTSTVSNVNTSDSTITVAHNTENFAGKPVGTPLYYDVVTSTGYFATNPRGVVYLKDNTNLDTGQSTFTVSEFPNGDALVLQASMTGTFQLANSARVFAGNNSDPLTEVPLNVVIGQSYEFEGANDGGDGASEAGGPNPLCTVASFSGSLVNVTTEAGAGLGYYTGAMVFYSVTDGSAASGLTNNTTYFVDSFFTTGTDTYALTLKEYPNQNTITSISGGTGTQTLTRIGVSSDKDIVHVKDSDFQVGDMVQYDYPTDGAFSAGDQQNYYFIETKYDTHNYQLSAQPFIPVTATGGSVTDIVEDGKAYRVHTFTSTGTTNFIVSDAGSEGIVEYLIVAGGGGGGMDMGGGGGAGGVLQGSVSVTAGTYPIVVGAGGNGAPRAGTGTNSQNRNSHVFTITGTNGGNSSFNGLTAVGGGRGGMSPWGQSNSRASGQAGGSGGGASGYDTPTGAGAGAGTFGQGHNGGPAVNRYYSGGGGGAGGIGGYNTYQYAMGGGIGVRSSILGPTYFFGGGGGGSGYSNQGGWGGRGGGGGGAVGTTYGGDGINSGANGGGGSPNSQTNRPGGSAGQNTGGGGGGGSHYSANNAGGNGGSGIVAVRYRTTKQEASPMIATGGDSVTDVRVAGVSYRIHAYTTPGANTFTVTNPGNLGQTEVLVVAGGGGGGGAYGAAGGGGAGGLVHHANKIMEPGTYQLSVGASGVAGGGYTGSNNANSAQHGRQGGNSTFDTMTANGGGGGVMSFYYVSNFRNGGSGGGAGDYYQNSGWVGGSRTQPFQTGGGMGYGFPGGSRGPSGEQGPITYESYNENGSHQSPHEGAGGGGAGSMAMNGSSARASDGGQGRNYPQFGIYGSPGGWFAGGGGGGYHNNTGNPRTNSQFIGGWWGGGGAGALERNNSSRPSGQKGDNGVPNTGGGGGGGGNVNNPNIPNNGGGTGGSGIVLVGYPLEVSPIVLQNLRIQLDPADSVSYAGDGLLKNVSLTDSGRTNIYNPVDFSLVGSPSFSALGGGSLVFNGGTTQYAQRANFWGQVMPGKPPNSYAEFNGEVSIEAWVRPTTLDGTQRHVFTDSNFNEGELYFDNNEITAYWGGGATARWSTTPVLNQWYHVMVTHKQDWRANYYTLRLYVDGVLRAEGFQLIQGSGSAYGPESTLNIGYQWAGNIGEFRIYSDVLEDYQVKRNYDGTKSRYGL